MRKARLYLPAIALASFALWCAQPGRDARANDVPIDAVRSLTVVSGGIQRSYLVAGAASTSKALPVVLILHGMGGDARHALVDYKWARLAKREHFIAVSLQGLPLDRTRPAMPAINPSHWNANPAEPVGVDDVAYARDVLADIDHRFRIDHARIYATGMSNGAGMTNRLASELVGTLAAIAPVAGNNWAVQSPSSPISVLMIFGRADRLLPIDGGVVRFPWGEVRQTAPRASAEKWARLLGCSSLITQRRGPNEQTVWTDCRMESSLTMMVVDGLGHIWPGLTKADLPERLAGPASENYDATEQIWSFFKAHSLLARESALFRKSG